MNISATILHCKTTSRRKLQTVLTNSKKIQKILFSMQWIFSRILQNFLIDCKINFNSASVIFSTRFFIFPKPARIYFFSQNLFQFFWEFKKESTKMIKKIIDIGLTAASILSLLNNNQKVDSKEKQREVQNTNKQISNFRNTAYIARRFF